MQVGSLVECIKLSDWINAKIRYPDLLGLHNIKIPKVGSVYTVRGFYLNELDKSKASHISIYLEEIINDPIFIDESIPSEEPSFSIDCFRELLPPINILKEIEEIEEPISL